VLAKPEVGVQTDPKSVTATESIDNTILTYQTGNLRLLWLLVTGYWLLVTGYWLLVTCYWLLVNWLPGYWLLVTGYW
jgi:hypothetical protein